MVTVKGGKAKKSTIHDRFELFLISVIELIKPPDEVGLEFAKIADVGLQVVDRIVGRCDVDINFNVYRNPGTLIDP